jgi:hypothetical protein
MQNNSKLELRHSESGREDGKGKGEQDGKESVKHFFLFKFRHNRWHLDAMTFTQRCVL